ncbi:MAG: metallophosphoesterase family protein [Candidatus Omnitrophota bacterium]
MRYAIFSDIHANLQAVESVLAELKKEKIDGYFCAGDVVGYGANPHECIGIVRDLNTVCVAGNHDWAVVDKVDIAYFNPTAQEAILWTRAKALREDMAFLDKLPLIYKNENFIMVHGTLDEPSYFHYLVDIRQAATMFRYMDRNVCFVGHSHVTDIFVLKDGKVARGLSADISVEKECKYIINVGSVGQPRDGNPKSSFCIYDTQENTISIRRVDYNITEAQKRILESGLSPFLASRLNLGR